LQATKPSEYKLDLGEIADARVGKQLMRHYRAGMSSSLELFTDITLDGQLLREGGHQRRCAAESGFATCDIVALPSRGLMTLLVQCLPPALSPWMRSGAVWLQGDDAAVSKHGSLQGGMPP